jgi:uncharacterized repeat protein (TIGR03803 family)
MKLIKVLTAMLTATLLLAMYAQAADKEKVIYTFKEKISGGYGPDGGLFIDPSGNLYGLADTGVFYELTPNGSGNGWNYTVLAPSCGYPLGPLVRDHAGNFFTANYFGQICEFSSNSSGGWTESVISTINNVSGAGPSNLLIDAAGNLYGVDGMNGAYGFGYVFELSPTSGGGWVLTDLYDFRGSDGNASSSGAAAAGALGGLIMDASGNLYGVTWAGGTSPKCGSKCGVVFKLTNNSGVWAETVLYNFNGTDGRAPAAPLLMDSSGNLYGTTTAGGTAGFGVVFEISAASGEAHVLHNFTNNNGDGAYPLAALIMDASGNLYGTTEGGGARGDCTVEQDQGGCGTAFKLSPEGSQWKESLLHDYSGLDDGAFPSGLVFDSNGNLYGVAPAGGYINQGVVFELVP